MFIGAQYYRPPFPHKKYWDDDLKKMRDTGLHAAQLWACWGWIEPEPGKFNYEDYDELINLADKNGLKIVISTIAEIQPFWIHRVVPDSMMVNHVGNRVISSLRGECNVGLTPGGCTDNPEVAKYMERFLRTTAERYRGTKNLIGWDCWNENRWAVNADGYVCYCPHTIEKYRGWLKEKYGDLEWLNLAWQRRYSSWDDVQPGKYPKPPFTENMEFASFITHRSNLHAKWRYGIIKSVNPSFFVSCHNGTASLVSTGGANEQTLCRGNDWSIADEMDGYGVSSFPAWGNGFDENFFGLRIEAIHSAVTSKKKVLWMSELQGGSARAGLMSDPPLEGKLQNLWVWSGISRGVKGVIFWCWRDEVFTGEASGFGIVGDDGNAEERVTELKHTCAVIDKNMDLFDRYVPDSAKAGVWFDPDNYYLNWSCDRDAIKARQGVFNYIHAYERLRVPYVIVEANHMEELMDGLKLLVMPWALIVKPELHDKLYKFVNSGGTLVFDAEFDAYTKLGFYKYPGEDRVLPTKFGIRDLGRRKIEEPTENIKFKLGNVKLDLRPTGWLTPLAYNGDAEVVAKNKAGDVMGIVKKVGKGRVIALGSFFGHDYTKDYHPGFETFVSTIVNTSCAGSEWDVVSSGGAKKQGKTAARTTGAIIGVGTSAGAQRVHFHAGTSGDKQVIILTNFGDAQKVDVRFQGKKVATVALEKHEYKAYVLAGKKLLEL
ncbi:MAG: beta-galactosidase [Elusimicrobiota bacterium]